MDSSARSRHDARQAFVFVVAVLSAIMLMAFAPGAKGEANSRPNVDGAPAGATHVAGQLLVAYEPGTSENAERAVVRGSGGRTAEDLPGKVSLVSFPGIRGEHSAKAKELALRHKLGELRDEPGVEAVDYNFIRRASWVPNDPKFGSLTVAASNDPGQWGLKTATFPGAWNDATGDTTGAGVRTAKIAIIDSGVDTGHPDIGNIAARKNFFNGTTNVDDGNGHGTHVTGIAAALTDNGRGVAGGCPDCRLLVAKVMDSSGLVKDSNVISAIDWSVNQKADVINLSFGGGQQSTVLEDTINKAYANGHGAVIVAAAGNTGTTTEQYPAAFPAAIAVSATNEYDKLASFSSRGGWVDLAAPGTDILSTSTGGGYDRESGTSESAPFVSALAGLLASEGKTAGEIRQRMQSTATDLGPAGTDRYFGHGRINANRAVP